MTISFSLGFVLVLFFIINTVITHLFNWWGRKLNTYNDADTLGYGFVYAFYTICNIMFLLYISKTF